MDKIKKSLLLAIMAVCSTVLFSACGDDDKKDEPYNPNDKSTYVLEYEVELSPAYLDYFDVEVSYTDISGQTVTLPMNGREYKNHESFPSTMLQDRYDLSVKLMAKQPLPVIDANKTYRFEQEYEIELDKDRRDFRHVGNTNSISIRGDQLERYINEKSGTYIISAYITTK